MEGENLREGDTSVEGGGERESSEGGRGGEEMDMTEVIIEGKPLENPESKVIESVDRGWSQKRGDHIKTKPNGRSLGTLLDVVSIMSHLTVFSVLGILIRSGLESLLGPQIGHVTDHNGALFVDLPANMVGSFIAGWTHIVVKDRISSFSSPLAVGLSTGLCGSITTFASWNQRMLSILGQGLWLRAISGYLVGLELCYMSLLVGIDSARGCIILFDRYKESYEKLGKPFPLSFLPGHKDREWRSLLVVFSTSVILFFGGAAGTAADTQCLKRRRVWLALLSGPFGSWIRWFFSQYNGGGIGAKQRFSWVPLGTLGVNLVASMVEASLSTLNVAVDTMASSLIVGGMQLGLLGCMSTVSTLMVEIYNLYRGNSDRWRAYVYPLLTVVLTCVSGILIYNVPVWVFSFERNYNHLDHC